MKTSIVILTINQLEYTQQCLDSIRQFTSPGTYEIIIVDNASNDGTQDWLVKQSDLKVVLNSENFGFPKGCNQGIEIATGDAVLLLNNDTVVTKGWLNNLLACLQSDESVGAVGPITNNCTNYQSIKVPYINLADMHPFAEQNNQSNSDKWEERLKLVGFCMLIRMSVIREIGHLDERFTPGNYEDNDYSLRIVQAGYRLLLCRDTFIHHYGSVSFNQNVNKFDNLLILNKQKFIDKWAFNPDEKGRIDYSLLEMCDFPQVRDFRLLVVGCGTGEMFLQLKACYLHIELYGVESNEAARAFASRTGTVCERLDELSGMKGAFDCILINEKLDYDWFNESNLRMMRLLLKTSGQMLLVWNNFMYHRTLLQLVQGKSDGLKQQFTVSELTTKLNEAGFKIHNSQIVKSDSITEEDEKWIQALTQFGGQENRSWYETLHMKLTFRVDVQPNGLSLVLQQLIDGGDPQPLLEELLQYKVQEVVEAADILQVNAVELLNFLISHLFQLGLGDELLSYLQQAYELDPTHSDTLYNYSYALQQCGEIKAAVAMIERMPDRNQEAEKLYQEILSQRDQDRTISWKIKTLVRRVEFDVLRESSALAVVRLLQESEMVMEQIREFSKDLIHKEETLNRLAEACWKEGYLEGVIPLFQMALGFNPQHTDTLYNLGAFLYSIGEYDFALKQLAAISTPDEGVIQLIRDIEGAVMA